MSGPTTAIFVADPITVLLSAAAIRASQVIAEGYANAESMHKEQQINRDHRLTQLRNAASSGREALQQELKTAETEFETMLKLARRYVTADKLTATRPAAPASNDEYQLAAYVHSMQALTQELRSILLTESALRMDNLGAENTLDSAIAQAAEADRKSDVQRLLARIAHLGEIPQNIDSVATEIAAAPFLDSERAKLLLTELRLRIQNRLEAEQKHAVQQATALILQQSLKDLGYQVEEVASTLFVAGGVVHFRRQGWDDYMVRMRVDPQAGTANFNVIRAVESASNERSVLDHIAEDRWCAEFPALLQALDVRGVHLNVSRRLQAGELPVQLIPKEKLPIFTDADAASRNKKLQTREIK
jgi:hypothetical protein